MKFCLIMSFYLKDTQNLNQVMSFNNPLVLNSNQTIKLSDVEAGNCSFNGYLVAKDYFESPSSSSASNSGVGENSDVQMTVSTFGDTLTIGNQSVIIPGISYQNTPESIFGSVTDIDGNTYQTINIDGTEWMTEDLKVTRFNNGDEIFQLPYSGYFDSNEFVPHQHWETTNTIQILLITIFMSSMILEMYVLRDGMLLQKMIMFKC